MLSGDFEFETDRARFLGRGRSAPNPAALETRAPLSSTAGPVLDPIFSLRRRVRLSPGASAVAFTTGRPRNRDEALALAIRFANLGAVDRAFDEAASSVHARLVELKLRLMMPKCFSAWPLTSFLRIHLCAQDLWQATNSGNPGCGRKRSPATCQSCCCGLERRPA